MLPDRLRSLFRLDPSATPSSTSPADGGAVDALQLAACALLLDVAYADGEFSPEERAHIERALEHRFGLAPNEGRGVIALAEQERARAVDHFAFTSTLLRGYGPEQKLLLAEVMWGVALADGEVAEHEHYLTRKIANLLELDPGDLSAAKRAAASGERGAGAAPPPLPN